MSQAWVLRSVTNVPDFSSPLQTPTHEQFLILGIISIMAPPQNTRSNNADPPYGLILSILALVFSLLVVFSLFVPKYRGCVVQWIRNLGPRRSVRPRSISMPTLFPRGSSHPWASNHSYLFEPAIPSVVEEPPPAYAEIGRPYRSTVRFAGGVWLAGLAPGSVPWRSQSSNAVSV